MNGPATCTADQIFTSETPGTAVTGSCTDAAGLTTNATPLTVRIDKTPPTVNITSPTNGAVYLFGSTVIASYFCSDNLSGVAFCLGNVPPGGRFDTSSAGSKTFMVNTMDPLGQDIVANASPLPVPIYTTTKYYLSVTKNDLAVEIGSRTVGPLKPGASDSSYKATARIPTGTATGVYYLLACADAFEQIKELNENNCRASMSTVNAR